MSYCLAESKLLTEDTDGRGAMSVGFANRIDLDVNNEVNGNL
jgi:hypothetical protein